MLVQRFSCQTTGQPRFFYTIYIAGLAINHRTIQHPGVFVIIMDYLLMNECIHICLFFFMREAISRTNRSERDLLIAIYRGLASFVRSDMYRLFLAVIITTQTIRTFFFHPFMHKALRTGSTWRSVPSDLIQSNGNLPSRKNYLITCYYTENNICATWRG